MNGQQAEKRAWGLKKDHQFCREDSGRWLGNCSDECSQGLQLAGGGSRNPKFARIPARSKGRNWTVQYRGAELDYTGWPASSPWVPKGQQLQGCGENSSLALKIRSSIHLGIFSPTLLLLLPSCLSSVLTCISALLRKDTAIYPAQAERSSTLSSGRKHRHISCLLKQIYGIFPACTHTQKA